MKTSEENLHRQLKQAVIKQKTSHLEMPEAQPRLLPLYQLLFQYEEHVSKLVFQVFQGNRMFIPFPLMDLLQEEFKKSESQADTETQRLIHQYYLYKTRLDEIYNLIEQILTTQKDGEYSNGG